VNGNNFQSSYESGVANRDGNTIGLFPISGGGGDPDFVDMGLTLPSRPYFPIVFANAFVT
jgi:hypothetical protein